MKRTSLPLLVLLCLFTLPSFADELPPVMPAFCALKGMDLRGKPWNRETMENGLEAFMFDLDGDNRSDLDMLVPQGDLNRYPVLYWVAGPDGKTEYTLEDTKRNGSCVGFKLIWDKYMPDWKGGA